MTCAFLSLAEQIVLRCTVDAQPQIVAQVSGRLKPCCKACSTSNLLKVFLKRKRNMNDIYAIVSRDDVAALAELVQRERRDDRSPVDGEADDELPLPEHCHELIKLLPLQRQWSLLLKMLNRFPALAVDHVSSPKTSQDWSVLRRAFVGPSAELTNRIVTYALTFQNQSAAVRNCHPFVVLFTDVMQSVQCDMTSVLSMLIRALGRPVRFLEGFAVDLKPYWCDDHTSSLSDEEACSIFLEEGAPLDPAADCHPWAKHASTATIRRNAALYICEIASRGYARAMLFVRVAALFLPGSFLIEGLTHAARSMRQRMLNSNRRFTTPARGDSDDLTCMFLADMTLMSGGAVDEELPAAGAKLIQVDPLEGETRRGSMCLVDAFQSLIARFSRKPPKLLPFPGDSPDSGASAPSSPPIPPLHLILLLSRTRLPPLVVLHCVTEWVTQYLPGGMRDTVLFENFVHMFDEEVLKSTAGSTPHVVWQYGRDVLKFRR